jgi:hypothetical protein
MTVFYWHIHHDVLCESLREPIEARIAYIKENKPQDERETRLRLLKPVLGALPTPVLEAYAARKKADAAWEKAYWAWRKADAHHKGEIEALHAQECPNCPWDGATIFPGGER